MKSIHVCRTLLMLLASTFASAQGAARAELDELTHKDLKESLLGVGLDVLHHVPVAVSNSKNPAPRKR